MEIVPPGNNQSLLQLPTRNLIVGGMIKPVITREEARERIATNVERLRGSMSQNELARRSGVAQSRISLLCKGELLPNPADLANVAEALGTTIDGLMEPVFHAAGK